MSAIVQLQGREQRTIKAVLERAKQLAAAISQVQPFSDVSWLPCLLYEEKKEKPLWKIRARPFEFLELTKHGQDRSRMSPLHETVLNPIDITDTYASAVPLKREAELSTEPSEPAAEADENLGTR